MILEFVGVDPRRCNMPGSQVVQLLQIDSAAVHACEVHMCVRLPSKLAMDRGRATIPQGVAPQKEWLGRHVAHGLLLLHSQDVALAADASVTLRIDLASDFHIRSYGRNTRWDGRSLTTSTGIVALLSITLNRQDPERKRTAEWRLYEGTWAISGKQLLNGGCAYVITPAGG